MVPTILVIFAAFLALMLPRASAVWPAPAHHSKGTHAVRLSESFSIPCGHLPSCPSDLQSAIFSVLRQIKRDHMTPLTVELGALEEDACASDHTLNELVLQLSIGQSRKLTPVGPLLPVDDISYEINRPPQDRDESYRLEVHVSSTRAILYANTTLGLLRGLQSFSQLVYAHREGDCRYVLEAPHLILDSPAYPVRGLLLDTSRSFYSPKSIRRILRAASWAKMSFFQWHITDSHAWPLRLRGHPELAEAGAYSHKQTYTVQDVQAVVSYANSIGIDVALEVDTPGHTRSIAESHPDLVACADLDWTTYAIEPPAGQLRIADPRASQLLQGVYGEIAELFPGNFVGTGGDEVNMACYHHDRPTQQALEITGRSLASVYAGFVNDTHQTIMRAGKNPLVWEELAAGQHAVELDSKVVVGAWKGRDTLNEILRAGFRVVQMSWDAFYLDCGRGSWVGYGDSWCPFNSWWKIYSFDMEAGVLEEHRDQVLGGAVALWSEQADETVVDSLLWPRTAAAAELWWLGSKGTNGKGLNASEALPRLHDFRYRLVRRGVAATPLQPHWCALRPGHCSL